MRDSNWPERSSWIVIATILIQAVSDDESNNSDAAAHQANSPCRSGMRGRRRLLSPLVFDNIWAEITGCGRAKVCNFVAKR
jgi:hypothetical protein